jgi:hypothetical protein
MKCRQRISTLDQRAKDALVFCRICFFGDDVFTEEEEAAHCLLSCHQCGYSGQSQKEAKSMKDEGREKGIRNS